MASSADIEFLYKVDIDFNDVRYDLMNAWRKATETKEEQDCQALLERCKIVNEALVPVKEYVSWGNERGLDTKVLLGAVRDAEEDMMTAEEEVMLIQQSWMSVQSPVQSPLQLPEQLPSQLPAQLKIVERSEVSVVLHDQNDSLESESVVNVVGSEVDIIDDVNDNVDIVDDKVYAKWISDVDNKVEEVIVNDDKIDVNNDVVDNSNDKSISLNSLASSAVLKRSFKEEEEEEELHLLILEAELRALKDKNELARQKMDIEEKEREVDVRLVKERLDLMAKQRQRQGGKLDESSHDSGMDVHSVDQMISSDQSQSFILICYSVDFMCVLVVMGELRFVFIVSLCYGSVNLM